MKTVAEFRIQHLQHLDAAVQEYQATVKQSTDAMVDHLYAHPPPYIEKQKALARRYAGTSRPSH